MPGCMKLCCSVFLHFYYGFFASLCMCILFPYYLSVCLFLIRLCVYVVLSVDPSVWIPYCMYCVRSFVVMCSGFSFPLSLIYLIWLCAVLYAYLLFRCYVIFRSFVSSCFRYVVWLFATSLSVVIVMPVLSSFTFCYTVGMVSYFRSMCRLVFHHGCMPVFLVLVFMFRLLVMWLVL